MLPLLFTITIPAGFALPLAGVVAIAVALARAWAFRRRAGAEGDRPGWGAALWDDRLTMGALLVALVVLWRGGALGGPLSLPLHTYGLLIALGFVVAIALAQREA